MSSQNSETKGSSDILSKVPFLPRDYCALDGTKDPTCRSQWETYQSNVPDLFFGTGDYQILRCRKCGAGMTSPYPPAEYIPYFYADRNSPDFDHIDASFLSKLKDYLARRELKGILKRYCRGQSNRFLDYGTGSGRFALQADRLDFEAHAVDFHALPATAFEGSRVIYGSISDFEQSELSYKIIMLRHVLEHVPYPHRLVQQLVQRLEPGGILYIQVPNLNTGCGRLFKKYWPGWYPPQHLYHLSKHYFATLFLKSNVSLRFHRGSTPLMGQLILNCLRRRRHSWLIAVIGIPLFAIQLLIEWAFRSSSDIFIDCIRDR